jgi:hypothetical protein
MNGTSLFPLLPHKGKLGSVQLELLLPYNVQRLYLRVLVRWDIASEQAAGVSQRSESWRFCVQKQRMNEDDRSVAEVGFLGAPGE